MLPIIYSYIPRTAYTNTHTCHICHLQRLQPSYTRLSACLNFLTVCPSVCLCFVYLCLYFYLSVCLSLWGLGHQVLFFLIASSLLQDHNSEVEHSSHICYARERQSMEVSGILNFQLSFSLSDCWGRLWDKKVKSVNHAFSAHTCVWEKKSLSIGVFSLTRGLGTICGLLLSHWENLRQTSAIKTP